MAFYIKTFPADTSHLSAEEEQVVGKLTAAAKLIVPLYEAQKNSKYAGANFYPHDATREEIEKAAKKNSAILNPYTFVERNKRGGLVAIPYSKKFKKELTQIAKLLREAAALSKDKKFKAYLIARAQDLLHDNFDKSNELWLKTGHSSIGFMIGPFDRFLDKLFYRKRAYTAWLGVANKERMEEISRIRELILTSMPTHLPESKQATVSEIRVRAEDTMILAGLDADYLFVSNSLPSSADVSFIKKHGIMSTVFLPMVQWRFTQWVEPVFQNLFDSATKKRYGIKDIRRGLLRISIIDEIRRSLVRYDDAPARLEEYFAYIDEVYGDLMTIKSASYLYLKGALTEKEFEAIVIAEICQVLYYVGSAKKRPQFEPLLFGYAAFIDALTESGALAKTRQGFRVDLQRVLVSTDQLTRVLEYYLALGSRKEAQKFFSAVDPQKAFKPFLPGLHTILKGES